MIKLKHIVFSLYLFILVLFHMVFITYGLFVSDPIMIFTSLLSFFFSRASNKESNYAFEIEGVCTLCHDQLFFKVLARQKPANQYGLISQTFYEHLLHTQIPKVQKDTDDLTFFLHFGDLRK